MAFLPSFRTTAALGATILFFAGCSGKSDSSEGAAEDETSGGAESTSTTFNPGTSASTTTGGSSASTTMGPADTGTGEEGSGDEASFISPPDGGVAGMCSPEAQDCPDGEKCTAYVSTPGSRIVDANKCVPIIGDQQFGDMCTREADNDDCAAGYFCMTDVSGHTGPGICLEFCDPAMPDTTCEDGGSCFGFNDGVLPLCEQLCDPLAPSCPPGQGCYIAIGNFVCATTKEPPSLQGEACQVIQSCEPGLACQPGPAGCVDACCTPFCDTTQPNTCPGAAMGEECVQAVADPPPGLENVGICVVPM
jgi:hypothetical protein